jgi:hypothetical protein
MENDSWLLYILLTISVFAIAFAAKGEICISELGTGVCQPFFDRCPSHVSWDSDGCSGNTDCCMTCCSGYPENFSGACLNKSSPLAHELCQFASNTVSMAQWSDPCSVPSIAHLTMESAGFSEARTRSIVDSQSPLYPTPCHVFVPHLSRLLSADSFMKSMIRSASPCLTKDTSSPPQSWLWRLKSPIIIISNAIPMSRRTSIITLRR